MSMRRLARKSRRGPGRVEQEALPDHALIRQAPKPSRSGGRGNAARESASAKLRLFVNGRRRRRGEAQPAPFG
jgi:hypothetical protein